MKFYATRKEWIREKQAKAEARNKARRTRLKIKQNDYEKTKN